MRLIPVIAMFAVALTALPAPGQQRLQELENKIKTAIGDKPAASPAGAPGTGYIGFVPDEAAEDGIGCAVLTVKPGGPSELGGLVPGDIITAINGKTCRNFNDMDTVLAQSSPGTKLTMTVSRSGIPKTLTITLGRKSIEAKAGEAPPLTPEAPAPTLVDPAGGTPASPNLELPPAPSTRPGFDPVTPKPSPLRPSFDPAAPVGPTVDPVPENPAPALDIPSDPNLPADPSEGGRPSLGISVLPLTEDVRAQFNITSAVRRGAVIQSIRRGSPADSAGLPLGGVIVAVNGQRIDTADDLVSFIRAARPGQEVEISYYNANRMSRKSLRLGAAAAVAIVPEGSESPSRPASGSSPFARKFEELVDPLTNPPAKSPAGSTILDPSAIATLQEQVRLMEERIHTLEARIKQLEGKDGGFAP